VNALLSPAGYVACENGYLRFMVHLEGKTNGVITLIYCVTQHDIRRLFCKYNTYSVRVNTAVKRVQNGTPNDIKLKSLT
jgi:hypothetical protein